MIIYFIGQIWNKMRGVEVISRGCNIDSQISKPQLEPWLV